MSFATSISDGELDIELPITPLTAYTGRMCQDGGQREPNPPASPGLISPKSVIFVSVLA